MKSKLLRITRMTIVTCCLLGVVTSAFAKRVSFEQNMPEGGKAVLTFASTPLLSMTEIPFTVELTGGTGVVIADAAVSLKLDMPAMPMPPNNPKTAWQDNAYHGKAIFTMAGEWDATMFIKRPGYDLVELSFPLGNVKMK